MGHKKKNDKITKGKGSIMIVDDEEVIREIASEIIHECGYKSICVKSGNEAIDFFTDNYSLVDIVVLDMQMPEISGRDIFVRLKEIDPSVNVLLSSGYKYDKKVDEVMALGVKGFLSKPYTINEFSEAINKII
ncbi:MAG: response regulator [Spirochaetes bacterium]|nr:response regulator [Spirochaetota bacterium]